MKQPDNIPPQLYSALKDEEIALAFISFLIKKFPHLSENELWAASLSIKSIQLGYTCLRIDDETLRRVGEECSIPGNLIPAASDILPSLQNSVLLHNASGAPFFVLDNQNNLYTHKNASLETELAAGILEKCSQEISREESKLPGGILDGLNDEQRKAVELSIRSKFLVITGGPGTGKTTTILSIIKAHIHLHKEKAKIALAAPTGKASARMEEAIQKGAGSDAKTESYKATTLHRLLSISMTGAAGFNKKNQLPHSLIVVDEASMIDLNLMVKLIRAIPSHAVLVLLGDKDQLASVESGAVFGDLCEGIFGELPSPEGKTRQIARVMLKKSYRFMKESGIGMAASHIQSGNVDEAMHALQHIGFSDIEWMNPDEPGHAKHLFEYFVLEPYREFIKRYKMLSDGEFLAHAVELHRILTRRQILCPNRIGKNGSEYLNRSLQQLLMEKTAQEQPSGWFTGKLVIVTKNDAELGLKNGDMGFITLKGGQPEAHFPVSEKEIHSISAYRIPAMETAYALTVHKSQGSEYEDVALYLPNQHSLLLTRELMYTALTRASRKIWIYGKKEVLRRALSFKTIRHTGLAKKLF